MMRGIDLGLFDLLCAFSIDFVASPKDFAPDLLAIQHQTRYGDSALNLKVVGS